MRARALRILTITLAGCGGPSAPLDAGPDVSSISGEPYAVGATERLGTLIGYGKLMPVADAPPNVRSPEAGGDVVFGTDEGFVTTLNVGGERRTYFFFGDTHGRPDLPDAAPTPFPDRGVSNGDVIAYTTDADPDDGIALDHVLRNDEGDGPQCASTIANGYRSVHVPGVNNTCTGNDDGVEVPTGIIALDGDPPRMVMWYGEAGDLADTSAGRSYIALSDDLGLHWSPLLDRAGVPFVFSRGAPAAPLRFLVVQPLLVDAADYASSASSPCQLPMPSGGDTRGLLLFGSGLYRRSDIYLGFVPLAALLDAFEDPASADLERAFSYFAGIGAADGPGGCWSSDQDDAIPVVRTSDPSPHAAFEAPCGNTILRSSSGAGEFSITHVQAGDFDRLVLLLNNQYAIHTGQPASRGVELVTGEPMRPWIWNTRVPSSELIGDEVQIDRPYAPIVIPRPSSGDDVPGYGTVCPSDWTVESSLWGYGPMLIDAYTRESADGLDLYFILSRWKGDLDLVSGPYRVDVFRTTLSDR